MTENREIIQPILKKTCDQHCTSLPCPVCAEDERYRQERIQHPEKLLQVLGVSKRHLSCSFENYQGGDRIKDALRSFTEDPIDVTITGGTGTGKTHLAVSLLRELIKAEKIDSGSSEFSSRTGCFISVPDLLVEIRASYREDGPREEDTIKKYSSVRYLVLDDLGAEKTSDWSISTLYTIIDRRHRMMLSTMVTSNLAINEIAANLSPRIASRLSSGKVIKLSGQDYRAKRSTHAS